MLLSFWFFQSCKPSESNFVDVIARWLYAMQTPSANPAFTDAGPWRGGRVPDYTNLFFIRVHQYKHEIARCIWFAICSEDLRVLMVEQLIAVWGLLRLSPISDGTARHAPLYEIASISSATQFLSSLRPCHPFRMYHSFFRDSSRSCWRSRGHRISPPILSQ